MGLVAGAYTQVQGGSSQKRRGPSMGRVACAEFGTQMHIRISGESTAYAVSAPQKHDYRSRFGTQKRICLGLSRSRTCDGISAGATVWS